MKSDEKSLTTRLKKWFKHNTTGTAAVEVKVTKDKSIPFDRLPYHQERSLQEAKHGKLIYKIPDFGAQNPFDLVVLSNVSSVVVVVFFKKKSKQQMFYIIDIDAWVEEKAESKRKSLTEKRAQQIGTACILE